MQKKNRALTFSCCFILLSAVSQAQEAQLAKADEWTGIYEEIYVTGGAAEINTLSGSATLLDTQEIEKFVTTDINALLSSVPGVYIRQEDGFGLRPNINLRGTVSDRSSKIAIMEDGILIGPAPYSAPAAYYVPNVARMQAVEVYKGPSAIQHGPHTVGGAINFVTRAIPDHFTGELELMAGTDGLERHRAFIGNNFENFGFWFDALRYGSDGFKSLDGGGDTGFVRNDVNAKFLWRIPGENLYQEFELKLGYADEDADETYLGLTDDDFADDPNRRYVASQLDNFQSEHQQIHLAHSMDFGDSKKLITRAYFNSFERAWNKVDGIINGPEIKDVLDNPALNASEIDLLRGDRDSNLLSAERIDITNNDRSFESYGLDSRISWEYILGSWDHELDAGVRFHHDRVERDHHQRGYFMQSRALVFDGDDTRPKKALNEGETDALALYVSDRISRDKWLFDLGLRFESMESEFVERAPGRERVQEDSREIVIPGVGVVYELSERLRFLAGINKGFSSKAASAPIATEPEESINYEAGVRFASNSASLDAIGFFSDAERLLGRCRASEACAGDEFNSGTAEVYGLELVGSYLWSFSNGISVPANVMYTFSHGEFTESFDSDFNQWLEVESGYEIPYLPQHQARAEVGIEGKNWNANLALKYTGKMRETAGSGDYVAGNYTDALTTGDVSLSYLPFDEITLKLVVENLTDEQKVVSRRPFGARPNQPRTVKLGVDYHF